MQQKITKTNLQNQWARRNITGCYDLIGVKQVHNCIPQENAVHKTGVPVTMCSDDLC